MHRDELRRRGKAVRSDLGLARASGNEPVPGFDDFMAEVAYGGVLDRPHLDKPERALCTLAVLGLSPSLPQLEKMVATALDLGLSAREILEVFMQAGLYGGYVRTEAASEIAHRVFAARGLTLAPEPDRTDSNAALDQRGHELMATLHGERAQAGYAAPGNDITGALYPSAIRYGYGELWFRPGLTHRQRMLVAIAAFTALRLESQLSKFAVSALNVGLTRDEVVETIIQTAPYSGFPGALNGLGLLSKALG